MTCSLTTPRQSSGSGSPVGCGPPRVFFGRSLIAKSPKSVQVLCDSRLGLRLKMCCHTREVFKTRFDLLNGSLIGVDGFLHSKNTFVDESAYRLGDIGDGTPVAQFVQSLYSLTHHHPHLIQPHGA